MIIYHGSSEIIVKPEYGKGKEYNDYGRGFYCTEHLELAKEWACTLNTDGYANKYEIDFENLKILRLSEYTILHWLALLMEYRKMRISSPVMRRGKEWLLENFLIDVEEYDLNIGYRADDSNFSFARSFVNNEISLKQLSYAMKLGKLGEQVVLKSRKAFESIKFIGYDVADNAKYYAKRMARDEKARADYFKEAEKEDIDGLYMRDILKEGVKADDPRIQ